MATYDEKLVDGKALDQLSVGIYNKLKQKIDEKPNTTVTGGKGVTVSKSVDDYTINIVSANTGITINDDNIQLNVVNDVTSGGVEKPLSAEQGKILKQKIDEKEPKINIKNSGFNLNKSDEINLDDSNTLATSKSVKLAYDKGVEAINSIGDKLNKGSLPSSVSDAKSIYDLIENNSGLNFDTALLYLNDAGTKAKGKVYFDRNKKGMFECIKETTGTVNSTEFFVDISNKSSSDRLTNLIKTVGTTHNTGGSGLKVVEIPHNENKVPKVIGLYLFGVDNPTEITYNAGNLRIIGITEKYFKVIYNRISPNGSYILNVSYTI